MGRQTLKSEEGNNSKICGIYASPENVVGDEIKGPLSRQIKFHAWPQGREHFKIPPFRSLILVPDRKECKIEISMGSKHSPEWNADRIGQILAVQLFQRRLVIKRVYLRRRAALAKLGTTTSCLLRSAIGSIPLQLDQNQGFCPYPMPWTRKKPRVPIHPEASW